MLLDEIIENLKVHEMIIKKDSEIVKAKGERKSLASKAKKESSDEECLTSRSKDENTPWCRPFDEGNAHGLPPRQSKSIPCASLAKEIGQFNPWAVLLHDPGLHMPTNDIAPFCQVGKGARAHGGLSEVREWIWC
nr:transposase, Ptta/En/Spm, transposase, Tnp1/En/Spm-like protein [Tanacetum cinerariifolium]